MQIEFDTDKRNKTLAERGLDFAQAVDIFAGPVMTLPDQRQDYGETRLITFGWLSLHFVAMVWTPRGAARRIISMRYANEREIAKHAHRLV